MLSAARGIGTRLIQQAKSARKPTNGAVTRRISKRPANLLVDHYGLLIAEKPRMRWFSPLTRAFHGSAQVFAPEESVETFLERAAIVTQKLDSDAALGEQERAQLVSEQLDHLKRALKVAKKAKAASKSVADEKAVLGIFITLVKTCDMRQRVSDTLEVIEDNKALLETKESIEAEIPGLYAEALWTSGRKDEARAISKLACERISALSSQSVHPEAVAVAYFNLALMEFELDDTDACIQTYKTAAAICEKAASRGPQSTSSSSTSSTSQSAQQQVDDYSVSDDVVAAINTNLTSLLIRAEQRTEALTYANIAVNCRERILRRDINDPQRRNELVMAIEALSALQLELGDSEASRMTWERATLILEYGGDTEGYIQREMEASKLEVNREHTTPAEVASVNHRHGKALLACNTPESLRDAVKPLKLACDTFREIGDKQSLLDTLEDVSNLNEALFYLSTKDSEGKASTSPALSYVDEQIAVFGECLALSESLYGAFYRENARYLNNLSIYTFERGENDRARDLAKAALYVCEKCKVDEQDEIYAHTKTLMVMMGLAKAEQEQVDALKNPVASKAYAKVVGSAKSQKL